MTVNHWKQFLFSGIGKSFSTDFNWSSLKINHGSQATGSDWKIFQNYIHTTGFYSYQLSDYKIVTDVSTKYEIQFAVKTSKDATLSLRIDSDKAFKIILGSHDNSRVVIRNNEWGPDLVKKYLSPLNSEEYINCRVSWYGSDLIVEKATYNEGAVTWYELIRLENWRSHHELGANSFIHSVGIVTYGPQGFWKIYDQDTHIVTPASEYKNHYKTAAQFSGQYSIDFAVKADINACVVLTTDQGSDFEICIGGYSGTSSVIRDSIAPGPPTMSEKLVSKHSKNT